MIFASPAHRQRGFSLIEIILVIGLMAAIAIAAFVVYPKFQVSQGVSDATEKYVLITSTTREYFGDEGFDGLTRATAVNGGVLAAEDLVTNWGDIQITGTGPSLQVDFLAIPKDACQKLVARLEPSSTALSVGSTVVKNSATPYSALGGPAACADVPQTISAWPM